MRNIDLFDDYLMGHLNAEDKKAFETRLSEDAALKSEFDTHKKFVKTFQANKSFTQQIAKSYQTARSLKTAREKLKTTCENYIVDYNSTGDTFSLVTTFNFLFKRTGDFYLFLNSSSMGLFDFLRATPLAFCCVSVVIPFVALSIGANCLLNLSQKACTKLNLTNGASACGTGLIHTKRFMRSVGSHFCASTSQLFFPYEYAIYVKNEDRDSNFHQNFINDLKQKMKTLNNNHNIVISNHILYTDWLYVWIFLLSVIDDPSSAVFIMKDSLQHVPVAGTVMRFLGCLFLKRNAQQDLPYLSEKVGNNKEKSIILPNTQYLRISSIWFSSISFLSLLCGN